MRPRQTSQRTSRPSRGSDRASDSAEQLYAWIALGVIVFTFYVSLLPFRFRLVEPIAAVSAFVASITTWPRRVPRANFIANALLFVPIGFALCGRRLAHLERRLSLGAVTSTVGTVLLVSLSAEFFQVFAPRRVVAAPDIVAQGLGAVLGMAAWAAAGPQVTAWLRRLASLRRDDRVVSLLVIYAGLWTFANLAPFDITLDVDTLARRFRDGMIVLVPFSARQTPVQMTWDGSITALCAVPLGVWLRARWLRSTDQRDGGHTWSLGIGWLIAVEVCQVFIRSHAADITDVLCGTVGLILGTAVPARSRPGAGTTTVPGDLSRQWACAGVIAWCGVLVFYHWQPFDFLVDERAIRAKLSRLSLIPFAGYRSGSDLVAFGNLMARAGLAVPLGLLAALATPQSRHRPWPTAIVWFIGSALVFGAVELRQFFVPSRIPDPTDVLIGITAGGLGVWIGRWLDSRTFAAGAAPASETHDQ